ncbi:MAG: hypothetical protein PWP37_86 [Thermotogota bacterium]|nr:hypothetical protein [Thermotogota bacterium]MDK2863894.1 hypothetical protein [Thermotogota bacterium]HCZ07114.1 metallophosphoesterase [Thermotogota bacterium]
MRWKAVALIVLTALLLTALTVKLHRSFVLPAAQRDLIYRNLQRIDASKEKFSFIVIGDNKNSISTFGKIIEKVNKDSAFFMIDTGDLVYDGDEEKYTFFLKQIEKLQKPLLTVIGNHELKEGGRGRYYEIFGPYYYSFHVGSAYFILLDDANEYRLDPWQFEWLQNELKKAQAFKFRFVFMHVPLFDPRTEKQPGYSLRDVEEARKLMDLFDRYNVSMVFASHIHGFFKGVWGNTPFIITGGAGAELVGTDPKHYFYHYVKVTVDPKQGISYDVVKLDNPDFNVVDRIFWAMWIYLYAFFVIHFWDIVIVIAGGYLITVYLFADRARRLRSIIDFFSRRRSLRFLFKKFVSHLKKHW